MKTTSKHGTVNTSRKRNNRTHALERTIIDDIYTRPLSSRQRKKLARVAHARNLRLGTTSGMKLAKNRRLDNRTFTVAGEVYNPHTDTVRHLRLEGTARNRETIRDSENKAWLATSEKYRKDTPPDVKPMRKGNNLTI